MTVYYVDLEGGNDANDGLSFANRKKTWAGRALSGGDELRVKRTRDPYSLGNATFVDNTQTITLATAKTVSVDNCDTAWTGSTNVTSTATTSVLANVWKEGSSAIRLSIANTFTTGKVAYRALGSTLNLSAYTCLSMRFGKNLAIAANTLRIDLCSDATGDVPVASLTLPAIALNVGHALFLDNGAALPSNVNSIAVYAIADPNTIALDFDNIIACQNRAHADHLCHDTLIGKNTLGEPHFYPIASIVGTTITVGNQQFTPTLAAAQRRPYRGTSETATLYAVAPYRMDAVSNFGNWAGGSGVAQMSGGWNATDMSTQDGETWISGIGYSNSAWGVASSHPVLSVSKINYAGFRVSVFPNGDLGAYLYASAKHAVDNVLISDRLNYGSRLFDIDYMSFNQAFGDFNSVSDQVWGRARIRSKSWFGSSQANFGFLAGAYRQPIPEKFAFEAEIAEIKNNAVGFSAGGAGNSGSNVRLKGATFSLNGADLPSSTYFAGALFLDGCTLAAAPSAVGNSGSVVWRNLNGTTYLTGLRTNMVAAFTQTTTVPPTGDTYAWQIAPGQANQGSVDQPLRISLAKLFVEAGKVYTVTFDMQRSSTSMLAGVGSDHNGATYRADIAAAANTWVGGTYSFTAAADDVVSIDALIYPSAGGTLNFFVGNLKWSVV